MTTVAERANLEALLDTIDGSSTALQRDMWRDYGRKGDLAIRGKFGHVYAEAFGAGYLICVVSERLSARRWNGIKRQLAFCRLTQDGDDEGCLSLDRLPTADEAIAIREALGIRKRRHLTAERLAELKAAGVKTAFRRQGLAETDGPLPTAPSKPERVIINAPSDTRNPGAAL